jgi:hypothetical protein
MSGVMPRPATYVRSWLNAYRRPRPSLTAAHRDAPSGWQLVGVSEALGRASGVVVTARPLKSTEPTRNRSSRLQVGLGGGRCVPTCSAA